MYRKGTNILHRVRYGKIKLWIGQTSIKKWQSPYQHLFASHGISRGFSTNSFIITPNRHQQKRAARLGGGGVSVYIVVGHHAEFASQPGLPDTIMLWMLGFLFLPAPPFSQQAFHSPQKFQHATMQLLSSSIWSLGGCHIHSIYCVPYPPVSMMRGRLIVTKCTITSTKCGLSRCGAPAPLLVSFLVALYNVCTHLVPDDGHDDDQ